MSDAPPLPIYFCVDVESSGPVPGLFNLLSLGCCVVRDEGEGPIELGPELYIELRPVFSGVEPEAMEVNGLDLESLYAEGLDPVEALGRLTAFVRSHVPEGRRALFVGHNAPFDWMMVRYYYAHFEPKGAQNPFGYAALDSKALAMGLFGLPWKRTNKEVLPGLLGLPAEDTGQKHRADYDARYQAEIFRGLLLKHRDVARREGR